MHRKNTQTNTKTTDELKEGPDGMNTRLPFVPLYCPLVYNIFHYNKGRLKPRLKVKVRPHITKTRVNRMLLRSRFNQASHNHRIENPSPHFREPWYKNCSGNRSFQTKTLLFILQGVDISSQKQITPPTPSFMDTLTLFTFQRRWLHVRRRTKLHKTKRLLRSCRAARRKKMEGCNCGGPKRRTSKPTTPTHLHSAHA